MPVVINAFVDPRVAVRQLQSTNAGLRAATSTALNRVAYLIRGEEIKVMGRIFDRPTPYTLGQIRVKPSTVQKMQAEVKLNDEALKAIPAGKYLHPQVYGGDRVMKRFERALQLRNLMPSGWFAVPTSEARYDSYGNVSRGQIVQILSQLGAQNSDGYTSALDKRNVKKVARASRRAGGLFFTVMPGDKRHNLRPGIWIRRDFAFFGGSHAVRPIFLFVKSVHYNKIFDFHGIATRRMAEDFGPEFRKALESRASAQPLVSVVGL